MIRQNRRRKQKEERKSKARFCCIGVRVYVQTVLEAETLNPRWVRLCGSVGRKTSTRVAPSRGFGSVAVAVAKRIPPVVRVVHSHGCRTHARARARGFLFNTQSARARGTEILSLVGIVHSFGWNAKNGTPTDGKVVRLFFVIVLVVYRNRPSGKDFAGRATGRAI